MDLDDSKNEDSLLKLDDSIIPITDDKEIKEIAPKIEDSSNTDMPKPEQPTKIIGDSIEDKKPIPKKTKRKAISSGQNSTESTPKKKKISKVLNVVKTPTKGSAKKVIISF